MRSQQTQQKRSSRQPTGPHIAVIGDMISSRSLTPSRRSRAQVEFSELIATLNHLYNKHLRAKFVITIGDEFQGLIRDPEIIPDLVWAIERRFTARALRLGFGCGTIYTAIKEFAINVDGPALHNARTAIEIAKRRKQQGGVFTGFGKTLDPALNGFARVLYHQRATWPARQREVVQGLQQGRKGIEIAGELGITKQAVSRYASLAGWEAYAEAAQGWAELLRTVTKEKR